MTLLFETSRNLERKLIRKTRPHSDMDKPGLYVEASTLGYGKLRVGTSDLFYPYPSGETLNMYSKKTFEMLSCVSSIVPLS